MANKPVPSVAAPGLHPGFPKIKSFLKAYENGLVDLTAEQFRMSRFASEGFGFTFKYDVTDVDRTYAISHAEQDLVRLANGERWHAVHAALEGKDWKERWGRTVAYTYWSGMLKLIQAEYLSTFPRFDSMKSGLWAKAVYELGIPLGECLAQGWLDWTVSGAERVYAAFKLAHGFNGDYQRNHPRTQYFVVRLIGDWLGWAQPEGPAYASDAPIFNTLVDHWRTSDPTHIAPWLLAACDRHTHESRIDTGKNKYDLPRHGYWYDPFEILAVLRLRAMNGLENPALPHRLMETPLGQLPEPSQPYMDDLLKGVIEQARKVFPDLPSISRSAEDCLAGR
jgi:hypothetical protein